MIKLISFNIKCGGKENRSIDYRAPLLKTVLEKYDADIIGLQEATPNWMEHIERDYGETYEIFNQYRSTERPESTPILWRRDRFECLNKGYFWFSETPDIESYGWDDRPHNRICLWVRLVDKKEGTTFVYFNTHYGFGAENQVKSSKLVLEHIRAMKAEAAFVTADFNMRPGSPGYNKLVEQLVDVNAATVNDLRNTYHGYAPEKRLNMPPIDFCFVTPQTVKPLTYHRIDDLVNGEFPSDHYGVYTELELCGKVRAATLNLDESRAPDGRTGMLRTLLKGQDVFGVQEMNAPLEEKLEKLSDYAHTAPREGTSIYWKKDKFELMQEEQIGARAELAVLKYRLGERKLCVVNAHSTAEDAEALAKEILQKAESLGEMPVIVLGDFGMEIGSPAYRILRETFADARRGADRYAPTVNGLGDEMLPPAIEDYIFVKGAKPVAYQVVSGWYKSGKIFATDHNCVSAEIIIN